MPKKSPNAGAGYEGCSFAHVLQAVFTSGTLTVDPEGQIVALTQQAEALLHLPEDSRQNPSLLKLPASLQTLIREVQKTGQPITDRRIALKFNGQKTVLIATALPATPSKLPGVVLLLKDVSSTHQLEEHLRRLDRLASIGTLSASMAHEIKNALVPVQTFVDLLIERNPTIELADTVRREMQRVDGIVSRMLKFSAPAKPAVAPVRLHEILDHSLRLVQHRIEGRTIVFKRLFDAPSDAFKGDDYQLEQVFVNLLLNAVESMGAEGTLTISTAVLTEREQIGSGQHLSVKISDTGAGIPAENMDAIFEPFFTTKHSGTGLGLSVTRRIIEEHNGTIHVESQPGHGTTFTIQLPTGSR